MKVHATLTCTALGTVTVAGAAVTEEISRPTHARLTVHADQSLDETAALGAKAVVSLSQAGKTVRTFELVVIAVSALETSGGDLVYQIELQHELALLSFRRDARIFLDKTAKDIVADVITGAGVGASLTWSVDRTLAKRESCTQYQETDLDFIARLLADEGISTFVKDGSGGVVLADGASAFVAIEDIEGKAKVPFSGENLGLGVDSFELTHSTVSDVVTLTDWNEKTPGVDLRATTVVSDLKASERFEYPGGYLTQDDGKALAKVRAEEVAASTVQGRGSCRHPQMAAGRWFELSPAPAAIARKYLLRSVTHTVSVVDDYTNAFVCSPLDLPFRPRRPRRKRHDAHATGTPGTHVATVAGPAGDEIHTDELGRMKATFAFDRVAKDKSMSSRWIRVVQPMLGGSMTLARVGWEMAVRYVDGDVDRPIAVGRMFDGVHPPPEALPGAQTTTGFQTVSSPNAEKRNAIWMKDEGGAMLFTLLAAKDFDATVNHDRVETIGGDESVAVDVDVTALIGGKQSISVDGDQSLTVHGDAGLAIAGDRTKTVTGDETTKVSGMLSFSVGGDDSESTTGKRSLAADDQVTETFQGARSLKVTGNVSTYAKKDYEIYVAGKSTETIDGAKSVSADDGSLSESIGGDYSITVGAARTETVTGKRISTVQGESSLTIGAAGSITATGKLQIKADKITIKVGGTATIVAGGGTVSITPASVTLVGMVTLKGSGGVELAGKPGMAG